MLQILVRYRGALPDLFREGHSVVAEGYLRPIDSYPARLEATNDTSAALAEKAKQVGCYFTAVDVLAKHDEVRTLCLSSSCTFVHRTLHACSAALKSLSHLMKYSRRFQRFVIRMTDGIQIDHHGLYRQSSGWLESCLDQVMALLSWFESWYV